MGVAEQGVLQVRAVFPRFWRAARCWSYPLAPTTAGVALFWGGAWDAQGVDRALTALLAGQTPWVCARCHPSAALISPLDEGTTLLDLGALLVGDDGQPVLRPRRTPRR